MCHPREQQILCKDSTVNLVSDDNFSLCIMFAGEFVKNSQQSIIKVSVGPAGKIVF